MKKYIGICFMMFLLIVSCEKDEIVVIEEQEIIIDSIDMSQYGQRHLENFRIINERPWRGGIVYRYESDIDSSHLSIKCFLFASYDEAKLFIIDDIKHIGAYMFPRTEDLEPLGNEYWRHPSTPPIYFILFRRYNAVFSIEYRYGEEVTPLARLLDDDILNRENYVFFKKVENY